MTDQLKAEDQMEWVGIMNNIRDRATEIVSTELIYAKKETAAFLLSPP